MPMPAWADITIITAIIIAITAITATTGVDRFAVGRRPIHIAPAAPNGTWPGLSTIASPMVTGRCRFQ